MDALVPDDLWAVVEPLRPPKPEKPKGGRPYVSDRAALSGIILVLRTGMQWKHLPRSEVGCSGKTSWRRQDELAAAGRMAAGGGLGRLASRDAGTASGCQCARLVTGCPRQREPAGEKRVITHPLARAGFR